MMSFVQKTLVDSDYHEFVNHKTRENDVAFVSFDPIGLLSTNHIVILKGIPKFIRKCSMLTLVTVDTTAAPTLYVVSQLYSWSLCSSLKYTDS